MRTTKISPTLLGIACLCVTVSPSRCFGQFGQPSFGGLGGGGVVNFSPVITNSLNRNSGPPAEVGMFERDRQENTARQKAKYSDSLFAKPLKPGSDPSYSGSLSARRAKNRKSEARDSDEASSAFRFPPGLRDVKKTRRSAMTARRPDPATESPDAQPPTRNP